MRNAKLIFRRNERGRLSRAEVIASLDREKVAIKLYGEAAVPNLRLGGPREVSSCASLIGGLQACRERDVSVGVPCSEKRQFDQKSSGSCHAPGSYRS